MTQLDQFNGFQTLINFGAFYWYRNSMYDAGRAAGLWVMGEAWNSSSHQGPWVVCVCGRGVSGAGLKTLSQILCLFQFQQLKQFP